MIVVKDDWQLWKHYTAKIIKTERLAQEKLGLMKQNINSRNWTLCLVRHKHGISNQRGKDELFTKSYCENCELFEIIS